MLSLRALYRRKLHGSILGGSIHVRGLWAVRVGTARAGLVNWLRSLGHVREVARLAYGICQRHWRAGKMRNVGGIL
jgi:hypothetical protein